MHIPITVKSTRCVPNTNNARMIYEDEDGTLFVGASQDVMNGDTIMAEVGAANEIIKIVQVIRKLNR